MPILNYTTTISSAKTAGEVQAMLGAHGANRVTSEYEGGRVAGVGFTLVTEFGPREFRMPIRADGVLAAMKADKKIPSSKSTPEQAERVAWRIGKDWLEAQIALVDAGMASVDEIMMPYMLTGDGRTAFEGYAAHQRAIETGEGDE